jgi:FkbM family methyltransferase
LDIVFLLKETVLLLPMTPLSWHDYVWAFLRRRRMRGFARLWHALRGPHATVRLRARFGATFALDPFAYIDGIVLEEAFYESEVFEALKPCLHAGAVLWDIGANFGLHAVTAARLHPEATVVAFEPNPSEHARLLLHRSWNAPQLVTSSLALSDSAGVLPLHLGPPGNSGMTTLTPWSAASYTGTVLVALVRGDDLIARAVLPAPTVIKLDVEGHELAVLRGLALAVAQPRCELIVFEDGAEPDTLVKQFLRTAGFTIAPLARREHTEHALANFAARRSYTV